MKRLKETLCRKPEGVHKNGNVFAAGSWTWTPSIKSSYATQSIRTETKRYLLCKSVPQFLHRFRHSTLVKAWKDDRDAEKLANGNRIPDVYNPTVVLRSWQNVCSKGPQRFRLPRSLGSSSACVVDVAPAPCTPWNGWHQLKEGILKHYLFFLVLFSQDCTCDTKLT